MFGGSRLDTSPALQLKLLVIYCMRYVVPLIKKRPSKIKMKDLLIKYDLFVRCTLFTEIYNSFLPSSPVLR